MFLTVFLSHISTVTDKMASLKEASPNNERAGDSEKTSIAVLWPCMITSQNSSLNRVKVVISKRFGIQGENALGVERLDNPSRDSASYLFFY